MTLQQIYQKLQDRVVTVVADRTGLAINTVHKIKNNGERANVTTKTLRILTDYFEAN